MYSAAWSPSSDSIAHTNGKSIVVKPIQPSGKTETVRTCIHANMHVWYDVV
jgi:hypothetical protein